MGSKHCFYNVDIYSHLAKLEKGALLLEGSRISDVISLKRFQKKQFPGFTMHNLEGFSIAPGLIDPHIHGLQGYGVEDESVEALLQMSLLLPQYGVTSFVPTFYTQAPQNFERMFGCGKEAKGKEEGAEILGFHLEGPFLSPKQAGAQLPKYMQLPSLKLMQKFMDLAGGQIVNMTVAPELRGMRELALFCLQNHIILQAGHSNALYEQILEGMQVGITHATHFFNAMRPLHHRNPGVVGAFLFQREASCEIIADGVHVHPTLVQLLLTQKDESKIVLVSDALRPTEQRSEVLYANKEQVYHDGTVFRRKKDHVIAGSSLTLWKAIRNLVSYGIPLGQALRMGSFNTAQVLKLPKKGRLFPGCDADIVLFDKNLNLKATFVKGRLCYNTLEPFQGGTLFR